MNAKEREQWLIALEVEMMGMQARRWIKQIGTTQRWMTGQSMTPLNLLVKSRAKRARIFSLAERVAGTAGLERVT